MFSFNILVFVCVLYVALLFLVAFGAEQRANDGKLGWLRSPWVYTLSLSIYCTAWTFYGAVGYAARSGLEFATIYLGPTLVMIGWWWLLRRLVRIGRTQRSTSIADLVSSRYGKSTSLGVLVTLMAVVGTTPYIALQLQSVVLSFGVFAAASAETVRDLPNSAALVAAGLTVFTIIFGTRNLDANERHHGVVTAIALEAVVKLVALLAVGAFVVWGLADGIGDVLTRINASDLPAWQLKPDRWTTLIFLSAAAFICLPRMFQVMVVENSDERHLATASWAFPLYLMLMSLFVLPIAVVGLDLLPEGSNPDLFVLTLPLEFGAESLALLSFLGGFSSATSMVIVAAIALSTMMSNHIVLPLWLNFRKSGANISGDVRFLLLTARRISIAAILALGYAYYRISGGGEALAAIGLISFTGVAQVLPALIGGIFWRGASRSGAAAGLIVGFAVWGYTMFVPSFGESALMSARVLSEGPWGIGLLHPRALFGFTGLDPLVHAVFWSVTLNLISFIAVSLVSFPSPIERLQGAQFVDVFDHSRATGRWTGGAAQAEDLLIMSQRILGAAEAQQIFQKQANEQGRQGYLPDVTPEFIAKLESALTGNVGSATAHAMLAQIVGGTSVSVQDLMAVADETAQMLEYSNQLEAKSAELSMTAQKLRDANEMLTQISIQKDAFLSQISHELRTPMTSIRAFSEILMNSDGDMPNEELARYSGIIHEESQRLTRLLDDLLDLSVLENGQVSLNFAEVQLSEVVERAIRAVGSSPDIARLRIENRAAELPIFVNTDPDRLAQVFINVISNAGKYCDADMPRLAISVSQSKNRVQIDFVDNGQGIPAKSRGMIFEKFSRLTDQASAGGAGLGLAICREIMVRLGGTIGYLPGQGGTAFRVTIPLVKAKNKPAE